MSSYHHSIFGHQNYCRFSRSELSSPIPQASCVACPTVQLPNGWLRFIGRCVCLPELIVWAVDFISWVPDCCEVVIFYRDPGATTRRNGRGDERNPRHFKHWVFDFEWVSFLTYMTYIWHIWPNHKMLRFCGDELKPVGQRLGTSWSFCGSGTWLLGIDLKIGVGRFGRRKRPGLPNLVMFLQLLVMFREQIYIYITNEWI